MKPIPYLLALTLTISIIFAIASEGNRKTDNSATEISQPNICSCDKALNEVVERIESIEGEITLLKDKSDLQGVQEQIEGMRQSINYYDAIFEDYFK